MGFIYKGFGKPLDVGCGGSTDLSLLNQCLVSTSQSFRRRLGDIERSEP